MSTLTLAALATLHAAERGRAEPIATVRHCHLATRPLVLVPVQLAGEACAPLAALVGTERERPVLLTVRQPLSRQLRFRFAAELGELLTGYLDWCRAGGTERVVRRRGVVDRYREALSSLCQTVVVSGSSRCSAAPLGCVVPADRTRSIR